MLGKIPDYMVPGRSLDREKKDLPAVSIIILNFNGRTHLEKCLPSLMALEYPSDRLEIIIADNASQDDSVQWLQRKYPHVKLVLNKSNLGFAAGINSGAEMAGGDYIAFLNPDMRVDKNWLLALVETAISQERVVCAGSIVLDWEGDKIDYAGRPNDALNLCPEAPPAAKPIVESATDGPMLFASGGAMLIDKEVFRSLGGFDKDYFMYHEDVDLGWRLWICGYKVFRSSKSIVYHRGGASSKKLLPNFVQCMAQRYALYTLLKNAEDTHLWSILSGVLWLLLERTRGFDPARLSLGDAIAELTREMDVVLAKRATVQAARKCSDEEIFELCGHPFGVIRENPKYKNCESYLAKQEEMQNFSDIDSASVSNQMIKILCRAYNRFNMDEPFDKQAINAKEGSAFLLIITEDVARWIAPKRRSNFVRSLWRRIRNRERVCGEAAECKDAWNESLLGGFRYAGNYPDSLGRIPHLMGQCNICGNTTVFFCNDKANYRESLKCASCHTTSRYRSLAQGIIRAVNDLTGSTAESIAGVALNDGKVPLMIYDTQVPFYTETDAYPIPDLLAKCKWLEVQKSAYLPQRQLGRRIAPSITNQNPENLTFPDNAFDIVIASDVMEHVRLDDKAHSEIRRVLKPGGIYIFTVPHNRAWKETLIRVQITDAEDPSKDIHLLEPEYHGDVNSEEGAALSYRTYGTDLDEKLREMGFAVDYIHQDCPDMGIMASEYYYCRLSK